jgi:four helix bundle protein
MALNHEPPTYQFINELRIARIIMSKYEDLDVWKLSHELVLDIYKVVDHLPNEEKYRLTDQLCRAVVSIPLNICEGTGRNTKKDFAHFLYIARGSLQETKYLLTLMGDLGYITNKDCSDLTKKCYVVGKLLNSLINSVLK